ncbi:sugar ABC transporter substrate-binding protein [Streptomyces sp. CB01881]|nr:hypothetical protein C2142_04725 [Streptomyces sp. CB01881]TYC76863.1 sugar ABC transporter substrate-binding protein [Streptomyces sp. CB01881]
MRGKGMVTELQGSLDSINGYERSDAFATCMRRNLPAIEVIALPTGWNGDVGSSKLQSTLAANPGLGRHLPAGRRHLPPAHPRPAPVEGPAQGRRQSGHIVIVSNDGIPAGLDAIRKGRIDATVNQPAGLSYAQAVAGIHRIFRQTRQGTLPGRPTPSQAWHQRGSCSVVPVPSSKR